MSVVVVEVVEEDGEKKIARQLCAATLYEAQRSNWPWHPYQSC